MYLARVRNLGARPAGYEPARNARGTIDAAVTAPTSRLPIEGDDTVNGPTRRVATITVYHRRPLR